MNSDEITQLVRLLGSDDSEEVKSAGDALLELGEAALPDVTEALQYGSPAIRKAAAFLAGRLGASEKAEAALQRALSDDEPKVRKNAAVSIGRLRSQGALPALREALEREQIAWVRPSLVLAIGMIGGTDARDTIHQLVPQSDGEAEAARKALDRTAALRTDVSWRADTAVPGDVFVACPVGLENVSTEEAVSCGMKRPKFVREGLLSFGRNFHPQDLVPRLRCVYDARVLLAKGPSLQAFAKMGKGDRAEGLAPAVLDIIKSSEALSGWRSWINADAPLGYRFSLQDVRVPEAAFKETLRMLRAELQPWGLEDRAANYSVELIVEAGETATDVWLKPTFVPDLRFAYRKKDVGASINPVVGACLARLVRSAESGVVFDPTCGSGTLLIERSRLSPEMKVRGLDISPTAVAAAQVNFEASGIAHASVERADASSLHFWRPCREVIANLPFGVRTRTQDRDLTNLYWRVVENTARSLEPGGKALFYTANVETIDAALNRATKLKTIQQITCRSGGVKVAVTLVTVR